MHRLLLVLFIMFSSVVSGDDGSALSKFGLHGIKFGMTMEEAKQINKNLKESSAYVWDIGEVKTLEYETSYLNRKSKVAIFFEDRELDHISFKFETSSDKECGDEFGKFLKELSNKFGKPNPGGNKSYAYWIMPEGESIKLDPEPCRQGEKLFFIDIEKT